MRLERYGVCLVTVLLCGVLVNASPSGAADVASRAERISLLRDQIAKAASPAEKVELEHTVAYLWLGEGCSDPVNTERFVREAERILREYKAVAYHYCYLHVKTTYAQLQPAEKREALLWEVINFDPRAIQPQAGKSAAKCVNRLKQGAVWAYLNGAVSGTMSAKRDVRARRFREEAEKLFTRLEGTVEGKRCIPLASWWRDVLLADKPRSVRVPRLSPPPRSKWDVVASDIGRPTSPTGVTARPASATKKPATRPKGVQIQRTFDSIKDLGTVTVPEPSDDGGAWLPWILGGAGALMLMAGVILVLRSRMERRRDTE